ncbi:MAG: helix-turn-helix domain-containing protein [Planctomycetota bacterium]|nr:helix-turn-helix domain-containing protein [Planctomycetota bacterium]
MNANTPGQSKARALRQHGTLNPRPGGVRGELFTGEFFDPADMMQVKYEMLRAVQQDGRPITEATAEFGLSRPVFYRAKEDLEQEGLAGLLPRKRGPKAPHKLSTEVLDYIRQLTRQDKRPRPQNVRDKVGAKFDIHVHTRTIRRAMERLQKKGHRP